MAKLVILKKPILKSKKKKGQKWVIGPPKKKSLFSKRPILLAFALIYKHSPSVFLAKLGGAKVPFCKYSFFKGESGTFSGPNIFVFLLLIEKLMVSVKFKFPKLNPPKFSKNGGGLKRFGFFPYRFFSPKKAFPWFFV